MKKALFILLVFLSMISIVSAIGTNNNEGYWTLDNTLNDSTAAARTLATSGGSFTNSGKINQAYLFDGVNDFLYNTSKINNVASINVWVNLSTNSTADTIVDQRPTAGANAGWYLHIDNQVGGELHVLDDDGATSRHCYSASLSWNTSQNYMVTFVINGSASQFYRNGQAVSMGACAITDTTSLTNSVESVQFRVGASQTAANAFPGVIDELSIWTSYKLTPTNISDLYNSDAALQYPYTGPPPATPIIDTDLNNVYNVSNITVNLNTNPLQNVNMSYVLDGGNETSICNDCNTSQVNFTSLSDALHNVTWISTDGSGQTNRSQAFIVDTQPANISVNNFTEWNNGYNVTSLNSTLNITCTDPNLVVCEIHWSDNTSTNLITTQNKVFSSNGNYTFVLHAHDLGNITSEANGSILINPSQYFYFQLGNGTPIVNFTLGGVNYTDFANITVFNDILSFGTNTLLFEKRGFASTNISFVINNTSELNITTNITQSIIVLSIFDRDTEKLIAPSTSTVTLIATVGFNATTTTGELNISNINFISERYQLIVENPFYETETIFFNYNNQKVLNINVYMINISQGDLGTITIKAIADTGELIEGAICSALEWKPAQSAYVSVAQGLTNINGETILNIEIGTKNYKFSCTKSGVTSISEPQIVQVTGTTLPVILSTSVLEPSPTLENLQFTFNNLTENITHQRLNFTWSDSDGLVNQGCINLYQVKGTNKILLNSTCVSSSTSQIQLVIDINQTYNTLATALVTIDGQDYELKSILFKGTTDISQALRDNNLHLIVPFLFALLGLVFGLNLKPQNIYISMVGMFIGIWFGVNIVTDVIPIGTVYFILVMLLLMLWGAYKFK